MTTLIDTLRGMTNAGTGDATVGTLTYWSDDEMQRVLDRHRTYVYQHELTPFETYAGAGTLVYLEYRAAYKNLESGTAVFEMEDATGATIGTGSYTADYINGIFTFDTNQAGSARVITTYAYKLEAAAADIWRIKSGLAAAGVNFSTDNMKVDRGKLIDNALRMADYYESKASAAVVNLSRSDMGD